MCWRKQKHIYGKEKEGQEKEEGPQKEKEIRSLLSRETKNP
jgi:hypothetical protein